MAKNPGILLAGEYVEHVGKRERAVGPHALFNRYPLFKASRLLGKVCSDSAGKELRHKTEEPKRIVEGIVGDSDQSPLIQEQARMLGIGILFAEKNYHHRSTERIRHRLQNETALQIRANLGRLAVKKDRKYHSNYLGYLAEISTIGLINYRREAAAIAILAPPHHDISRPNQTRKNYDAVFIHTDGKKAYSQGIQVKLSCQMFCEKPISSRNDLRNYSNEIALVSGHCDLEMTRDDLSVPTLIMQSALDPESVSGEGYARLDELSERLVSTLIHQGSTSRAGTGEQNR